MHEGRNGLVAANKRRERGEDPLSQSDATSPVTPRVIPVHLLENELARPIAFKSCPPVGPSSVTSSPSEPTSASVLIMSA